MKALRVRKVALCALFICIAAVLSAVESFLPPICAIPGVRVGLGNIVTMFMLYIGGKWRSLDVMLVVILRCFVAAFSNYVTHLVIILNGFWNVNCFLPIFCIFS